MKRERENDSDEGETEFDYDFTPLLSTLDAQQKRCLLRDTARFIIEDDTAATVDELKAFLGGTVSAMRSFVAEVEARTWRRIAALNDAANADRAWTNLPPEVLARVIHYLPSAHDLGRLSQSCRKFYTSVWPLLPELVVTRDWADFFPYPLSRCSSLRTLEVVQKEKERFFSRSGDLYRCFAHVASNPRLQHLTGLRSLDLRQS
eukprot:TRINITY_DN19978_c0_g1_i1.p1 TRINITY_DN19978_c0_g1~~TRINITY_DN19978_c0_g1_i1.p1  ORF type:complete len:204 (-),score=55.20 TRINITY_DN19978_c0_g1_i1:270-881(-)